MLCCDSEICENLSIFSSIIVVEDTAAAAAESSSQYHGIGMGTYLLKVPTYIFLYVVPAVGSD